MITGGMGYIGSVVTQYLKKKEIETKIIDIKNGKNILTLTHEDFKGVDAVIHLAAIVGKDACEEDAELALNTNVKGTLKLKHYCQDTIPIIFASTCSVYGPKSIYSESKKQAELFLNHHDTILRFGTAFGWSSAMRYNIVINKLISDVRFHNKITIYGGDQWRPFVHVKDIARIIYKCLKHHIVGTHDVAVENVMLLTLGKRMQACFPGTRLDVINHIQDDRSYKASCPFEMKYSLEYGFREIYDNLWVTPTPKHLELTKWNWLVSYPENLKLGKCDIGAFTYINAQYGVEIGDNVQIGSHCSIYSNNTENGTYGKVIIEEGAKIGSHSLILPNTHIVKNQKIKAYSIIGSDE